MASGLIAQINGSELVFPSGNKDPRGHLKNGKSVVVIDHRSRPESAAESARRLVEAAAQRLNYVGQGLTRFPIQCFPFNTQSGAGLPFGRAKHSARCGIQDSNLKYAM